MVKQFLVEGIQIKINGARLGMFGDGETLERVLNVYEIEKKIAQQNILEFKTSWSTRPASPPELCIENNISSGALNIL